MTQPTRRLLMFAFLFIAVCTLSVHAAEPASAAARRFTGDEHTGSCACRGRSNPVGCLQDTAAGPQGPSHHP